MISGDEDPSTQNKLTGCFYGSQFFFKKREVDLSLDR
jgi:hypothetical protein